MQNIQYYSTGDQLINEIVNKFIEKNACSANIREKKLLGIVDKYALHVHGYAVRKIRKDMLEFSILLSYDLLLKIAKAGIITDSQRIFKLIGDIFCDMGFTINNVYLKSYYNNYSCDDIEYTVLTDYPKFLKNIVG